MSLFRGLQRLAMVTTTQSAGTGSRFQSIGNTAFSNQWKFSSITANRFSTTGAKPATKEEIDKLVKNKKLVVFMKGVPEEPRCGFSNAVVQVLRMHGVTKYESYDVLQNDSIRQGIKEYSNWPTIPQIYINGEFVGGCDIFLEMHKNGELEQQFEKAGIESTPVKPHDTNEK